MTRTVKRRSEDNHSGGIVGGGEHGCEEDGGHANTRRRTRLKKQKTQTIFLWLCFPSSEGCESCQERAPRRKHMSGYMLMWMEWLKLIHLRVRPPSVRSPCLRRISVSSSD